MRVLLVGFAHFCDSQGGSQRIVHDEAVQLESYGHEVWVLAPGDPALPEHEVRNGIHLLRYSVKRVGDWNPSRSTVHRQASKAILARYLPQIDAIHGHAPLAYLAALDHFGAAAHSCYTIHSPARMEMAIVWRSATILRRLVAPAALEMLNRMERDCLMRSSVVTALSQFTIDCVARLHGQILAKKVQLLRGWVDTSRFVPVSDISKARDRLHWTSDAPIFFTVRRLTARMGLDRLLIACARLHAQQLPFRLMIAGAGPLRESLERQSIDLGLQGIVTFLGRLDDDTLQLAYAACDAFVLPTAELECFGLIALEALSAGKPVLATPVGAIPEILSKFEPAWMAGGAKVEDIFDLLRRFLERLLPVRDAAQLHAQAVRDFGRTTLLPRFVQTALSLAS